MLVENWVNVLPWHPTRRWSKRSVSEIDKIIIHQTLSVGSIRAINNYHITPGSQNHLSQKGAPHIAYNYLIDRAGDDGIDGRIIRANNLDDIVWHTKGQNRVGIGISICGNFVGEGYNDGEKGPTAAPMKSLAQLVEILQNAYNIPNTKVYGHYHFGKPACPGTAVKKWIEKFRSPSLEDVTEPDIRDRATAIYTKLCQMFSTDRIKFYQKALNTLGYSVGRADGIMGTQTQSGIRSFQRDYGLNVDGVMGPVSTHRLITEVLKLGKDINPENIEEIVSQSEHIIP